MSNGQLTIIFVDDEPHILNGLRRQLRASRKNWDMRFANSGPEALQMLKERPAAIIVTDMRMPGMSGGELLSHILKEHPEMTRIVLSGQTDQAELLHDVSSVHQYLQKPCEPPQICHAIERTFELSKQLKRRELQLAANRITSLPPASKAYRALVGELMRDDADMTAVSRIVSTDPALTVKLMQLVNSAFFGIPRKITSPHEAVVLLGLNTLRALVVTGRMFEFVKEESGTSSHLGKLWSDSYEVGQLAGHLARLNGAPEASQNNCRLAGLLSLIGRGILMTAEPSLYGKVIEAARQTGQSISACEAEVFGVSQDVVSAYAIGLWAFSDELVAALAAQNLPSSLVDIGPHHPAGYLHVARCWRPSVIDGVKDAPSIDEKYPGVWHLDSLCSRAQRNVA